MNLKEVYGKRCPTCGYRVRGSLHDEGTHHKNKRRSKSIRRSLAEASRKAAVQRALHNKKGKF